jgi:hypothetical protein
MCAKCKAIKFNPPFGRGWHVMSAAPKDGSIIEIENRWGAKPWRGLFRWADGTTPVPADERARGEDPGAHGWRNVQHPTMGFIGGAFAWRPFAGDPAKYEDPYDGFDDFNYVILGKRPVLKLAAAEARYAANI